MSNNKNKSANLPEAIEMAKAARMRTRMMIRSPRSEIYWYQCKGTRSRFAPLA